MLAEELGAVERPADTRFAEQVDLALNEVLRYRRQLRRAFLDGLTEVAAAAALVCGLILLSRAAPFAPMVGDGLLRLSSPLALVLLLWLGAQRWKLA